MAFDEDGTERETVPLPDTEAADDNLSSDTGLEGDVDSITVTSSRTGDGPGHDRRRPAVPSGRSKGLVAAAVAGVLVVVGAVAATVGGGSGKGPDKSAAPTAGLVGQQIPSSSGDNGYASGATGGSPWVWQTGQQTAKYPGAATGTASSAGAPKPTGSGSVPGAQSSVPGLSQRSSSAPGAPPAPPSSVGGPASPPPSAPPATVTLVAGPGCPGLAGSGGYSSVGSGASSGWGSSGSGGWSGDGCNGSMQSMPMTGDSSNGPNRAVWSFGSGTAGFASCVVSVYVPWDGKATDTGGTAAGYQVSEGAADTTVANFTVDQNATHGQWTTLGTVNVAGASVKLRLLDHGVDYPAGWRYGISAAKLQCTA
ncbi:hypothetical protein ABH926_008377 [Catenulispora sp. GP43]|uniref:hypothetical protein n=1 Tax=Catenulispora sp. GP43 TaxID=3156263 RepID=UPI0035165D89